MKKRIYRALYEELNNVSKKEEKAPKEAKKPEKDEKKKENK
jgi:hypothetical protein